MASRLLIEGAQEVIASSTRAGEGEADFRDEENLWDQISWRFWQRLVPSKSTYTSASSVTAFLEDQMSRLRYFGQSASRPIRGDETPRVVDSPIAEVFEDSEEGERLEQTSPFGGHAVGFGARSRKGPCGQRSGGRVGLRGRDTPCATVDPTTIFMGASGSVLKRRLHLGGPAGAFLAKITLSSSIAVKTSLSPRPFHAVCKQGFPLGVQSDVLGEELSSSGSSKTSEEDSA